MNKTSTLHLKWRFNPTKLSAISLALSAALIACNTTPNTKDPYANGVRKQWTSGLTTSPALHTGYLSDQESGAATNAWGPIEKDLANGNDGLGDGDKIKIKGVTFNKGLGVHADSSVEFNLNKNCSSFTASVGVDDAEKWNPSTGGTVDFQVFVDGAQLFDSQVMKRGESAKSVNVSLAGGQTLKLVVMDGGDGIAYDHADWAEAQVTCDTASSPPPATNVLSTGYVSDQLALASNPTNGWGPIEKDLANGDDQAGDGDQISINRVTFNKGIGVHAKSSIEFPLGGQCSSFTASVGVDDAAKYSPVNGGTVDFQVFVDGVNRFDSQVMKRGEAAKLASVSLTGGQTLKLVVSDAGDGNTFDHGDWADAKVICGGVSNPTPPDHSRKLILFQASNLPTPAYVASHINEVNSLPFEGILVDIPSRNMNRGASVISVSQFKSELADMVKARAGLTKVRHNFVYVRLVQKGSFDSMIPVVAQNFANLAEAARDAGLEGIFFDNEDYASDMWNPETACPGKTIPDCQTIAVSAGKTVMQAIIAKWPTVRILVANGTVFADADTYQKYIEPSMPDFLILGAYATGFSLAAIGTEATFIDGGEQEFYNHTQAKSDEHYNIRKKVFPTQSTLIPAALKASWPQSVSIGFAIYDEIGTAPLTTPGRWQDDISTHVKTADEYTWAHSFWHVWVGPLVTNKLAATDEWVNATKAGRIAAGLPALPQP